MPASCRLNYSDNDLNELLEDVSVQIADRLQESGISLEIVAPAHLGSLVADHQRLKQILIKLLTNAINFAPEGSSVQLSCQRSEVTSCSRWRTRVRVFLKTC